MQQQCRQSASPAPCSPPPCKKSKGVFLFLFLCFLRVVREERGEREGRRSDCLTSHTLPHITITSSFLHHHFTHTTTATHITHTHRHYFTDTLLLLPPLTPHTHFINNTETHITIFTDYHTHYHYTLFLLSFLITLSFLVITVFFHLFSNYQFGHFSLLSFSFLSFHFHCHCFPS